MRGCGDDREWAQRGVIAAWWAPLTSPPTVVAAVAVARRVKHQPQRVGKDHLLEDEDIVQIVKKG